MSSGFPDIYYRTYRVSVNGVSYCDKSVNDLLLKRNPERTTLSEVLTDIEAIHGKVQLISFRTAQLRMTPGHTAMIQFMTTEGFSGCIDSDYPVNAKEEFEGITKTKVS